MAADDVDIDAKEVGQLASKPGEVEKRGISWDIYKEVDIRARVSVSSGARPEDTHVRDPVPIGQRLNVVLPGLDHLTESRTLDGSFSHRPLHLAQETLRLVRPRMVASTVGLPTVCQRSATNGIRSVCLRLNVRFQVRDGRWVRRSRTPIPVVRSTAVPAGGYRGAQQFPLVAAAQRCESGELHPIQVRPSRMMMWNSMYQNDDIEVDG